MKKFLSAHLHLTAWGLYFLFFLSISFFGYSQSSGDVTTPGPISSALGQYALGYGDLHTGVPDISIPLYTIQSRKLNYPISISYNGLGNKVDDQAGMLGLGWNINAGGIIARAFHGAPDESSEGFFKYMGAIPNDTDVIPLDTKFNIAKGNFDMLPDIFYFNTGISTGKFMFDNQGIPRNIPGGDIRITVDNNTTLGVFTITTPDGTQYNFQGTETVNVLGVNYFSTWYLTNIISADQKDTITFNYTTIGTTSYVTGNGNGLYEYFPNAPASGALGDPNNPTVVCSHCGISLASTRYLSSIVYDNGQIDLSIASRNDIPGSLYSTILCRRKHPLSHSLQIDKSVKFNYSYFQNLMNGKTDGGTRLRLDGLQEYNSLGLPTQAPYQFFYSAHQLPQPGSSKNSFGQDKWGYYNGVTTNTGLLPAYTAPGYGYVLSSNDMEVHVGGVDGFIISQIKNPLGGIIDYVFESNDYGASKTPGPGLRIKTITQTDPNSAVKAISNFVYTDPTGSGSGVLVNIPPVPEDIMVYENHADVSLNYHCYLVPMNANGVGNYSDSPVIYEYVTQYEGSDASVSGKVISRFSTYTPSTHNFPYVPETDNSWQGGQLTEAYYYSVTKDGNGVLSSTLVKEIHNFYNTYTYANVKGLKGNFKIIRPARERDYITDVDYSFKNFKTDIAVKYLYKQTVTNYEQGSVSLGTLQTTINTYGKLGFYLSPTKISTSTSEAGVWQQQEFKYPLDYSNTGALGKMQGLNMKSYPVEVISSRLEGVTFNGTTLQGGTEYVTGYKKTDYLEWFTNGLYPQNIYRSKPGATAVSRTTFNSSPSSYCQLSLTFNKYDDAGFTSEMQKIGDIPQAILTDPILFEPISTVSNALTNQVAYTSFETSDFGGWTFAVGSTSQSNPQDLSGFSDEVPKNLVIPFSQTVTYSVTFNKSGGGPCQLKFTKTGATDIIISFIPNQPGVAQTNTGTASLSAGTWQVTLEWDTQFTIISNAHVAYFGSPTSVPLDVNYLSFGRTGGFSLGIQSGQTISKSGLPPGDYLLTYYFKNGTATLTMGGSASEVSSTSVSGADGWNLVRKVIRIVNSSDGLSLTGSCSLDELRLYPVGSHMNTISYDGKGRIITDTDTNLRSQFYEYDAAGRKISIRDHDRNILTLYQYHTKGN